MGWIMGNIIEIEGFINRILCSDEYVVYYPDHIPIAMERMRIVKERL